MQPGENPFARAGGVVIDDQVDPFADGEIGRVLVLAVEFVVDRLYCRDEAGRRRRVGAEERVASCTARANALAALAPNQIGGWGR